MINLCKNSIYVNSIKCPNDPGILEPQPDLIFTIDYIQDVSSLNYIIIKFCWISQMLHLKWMHILKVKFVLKIINSHIIIDINQNVVDHD